MNARGGMSAPALCVLLATLASVVSPVMKGGRIFDPAGIEHALGIAPRDRT